MSQTGGETETKMSNAMAANAKKRPGNAGETIMSELFGLLEGKGNGN